jgi:hypothetical protein
MDKFTRTKEGFRFAFGGMKTNAAPDSLAPDKYPVAINVRGVGDNSTQTRPGIATLFQAGLSVFITDIRAYTALSTDNLPRILAHDGLDRIFLDTGVQVGTLLGSGGTSLGASMIPFRPNASPNPYMYIANGVDYQKFSAPVANAVSAQKVGIAEPQTPPDAAIFFGITAPFVSTAAFFVPGGTAGAAAAAIRTTDTVGQVFLDTYGFVYSVQVTNAAQYQKRMTLLIGGVQFLMQDVIPPLTAPLNVTGIFYTGVGGRCVVVPSNLMSGPGNDESSIYAQSLVSTLRRGAIIKIGTEFCLVLNVTSGPDGSVAIETSTTVTHVAGETLSSVATITVSASGGTPVAGQAIASNSSRTTVTAGVGTLRAASLFNQFVAANQAFQADDYISFGLKVDNLANLAEIKILFDVGDGTFTKDFYYYTVRPSDIAAAVANSATQMAAVQTMLQRAIVDAKVGKAAGNQQQASSGAQLSPGSNTWTQIVFSLRELTRVGSDQSKTLQNTVAMQILWNASGTIVAEVDNIFNLFGGYQPDVGAVGAPYRYRVRPRSSVTGVVGNPSPAMRYGVSPRRESVDVHLPSAAYDSQIDTWDIFRYGGSVTSWRYVGSTPSRVDNNGRFTDNFGDAAARGGSALDFDNFEPWPSVDVPNNGTATSITGTTALVVSPSTNITRYLPGTLVQFGGQNVYTLWARPTLVGGTTYLLQFVENAGVAASVQYRILEPLLARQPLPYMFGVDAEGTLFACGDPLHPGTLYFSKNYAPDSAPDRYNIEISPPTEPLLGGEILDGLPFVASTEHWWRLYPQGTAYLNPQNRVQRYTPVLQPIQRGMVAPFGHCTDGVSLFWWAKDGIWSSAKGSLTDADLYNLFPHEGVPGTDVVYGGVTIKPPSYANAGLMRLVYSNYYLYAIYLDSDFIFRCLVYDVRREAWCLDLYPQFISTAYHVEQAPGSFGTPNPVLLLGTRNNSITYTALVCKQAPNINDNGTPIACVLATREYDGGDIRAGEQWGDIYLDSTPVARGSAMTLTPMFLGQVAAAVKTVPQSTARVQQPISIGGELTTNFLGALLQWTDDFALQTGPTMLFAWQPSFLPQPEITTDRISNWDDGGSPGAKWVQGFVMEADTSNVAKGLSIQDADTLAVHTFTPTVVHNGQSERAYSFDTPFIAHMMRVKPTDQVPWRFWDIKWIAEPTPETALTWKTQPSTHGLKGYMHVRQVSITYASSQVVTLAIAVFDGTSPVAIALPSTGGAVKKVVVPLTFNKGQLYSYNFTSAATFQVYQDKCEVLVGEWGRNGGYISRPLVGGTGGDEAKV